MLKERLWRGLVYPYGIIHARGGDRRGRSGASRGIFGCGRVRPERLILMMRLMEKLRWRLASTEYVQSGVSGLQHIAAFRDLGVEDACTDPAGTARNVRAARIDRNAAVQILEYSNGSGDKA